jgi:hypothetical protein
LILTRVNTHAELITAPHYKNQNLPKIVYRWRCGGQDFRHL